MPVIRHPGRHSLVAASLTPPIIARRSCASTPDPHRILTGGTEHLALAALEILSRLRQRGRSGRIVLLNDGDEGYGRLNRMATFMDVRDHLASMRLGRIGRPSDWLVASMPDANRVTDVWRPSIIDVAMDAVVAAMRHVVHACQLDACAVRCFDLVVDQRTTGCLALSWLFDEGFVAGREGDVLGRSCC